MSQTAPEISVILVSYNTVGYIRRALESLYRETQLATFEVIVVDNASSDNSAAMIRQFFPQATLIESGSNLGFAGGVQLGAKQAQGQYLLLLNPDTIILNAAVDRLLHFAKLCPDNGIWSGVTRNQDMSLNTQHAWARPSFPDLLFSALGLSKLFSNTCLFNHANYGCWKRDSVKEVDIVSGCFFLTSRALWDKLGGLDPSFFMYAEEADYCLRAKALGYQPIVTPDAQIVHHGGVSHSHFSGKLVKLLKGKVELINRHVSPAKRPAYRFLLYLYVLNKYLLHSLLKPRSEQRREWQAVFAQRADWLQGYR
ncbi:glycosyltransferase family 2 protein [Candidatus Thiothrix sp. Deng01]|uniref:Glycosyltransferase family 2 protein n=1 Tax=Candidatus Thiothrix phosphatis TaxID=3112415 RepID=A0ABU6CTZ3_9GAMM|nr:glycosyltransferase family 2 protein [Candidatus Thiothrix sp. Deng01]MEB4589563.1 glycosyltransferase family 2 protein [Candidatus Thiothrix sp. Deng01]